MKKIKLSILAISFLIIISCCNDLFPDEKLTLQRRDYTGNELRIDGYYYLYQQDPERTQLLILYRNGILISTRSYPSHDLNVIEKSLLSAYDELKNEKTRWGVFMVLNSKIEYERWNGTTGIGLPIIKRKGIIENDTVFRITETYYSDSKKTDYQEFVYRFKQFDNKPDSTNIFIK